LFNFYLSGTALCLQWGVGMEYFYLFSGTALCLQWGVGMELFFLF
jgi:hypothetical protein